MPSKGMVKRSSKEAKGLANFNIRPEKKQSVAEGSSKNDVKIEPRSLSLYIAKKVNKQIKNAHNNKPPSRLPHHAEKRYMVGCDFDDTVAT